MKAAVFDFDGTLCPGDSVVRYLRFCVREGIAPKRQWIEAARGYFDQRLHPERISAAKARALSFIAGRERSVMDEAAKRFFAEELKPRFHAEGLREMERLGAAGCRIVVLSASASVYMDALTEFMPADAVLSTPCECVGGRYTGRVGANCRDEEKVRRLREWADDEELRIVSAYGDSVHDVPLLSLAEEPVWVNPSGKALRAFPAKTVRWGGDG